MRRINKKINGYPEGTQPKDINVTKYKTPYHYMDGKVKVLLWCRWPSYDFIFGIPTKKDKKNYGKEWAFFQYRDTRAKKVKQGFYVDRGELLRLRQGFNKIWDLQSKPKKK